MGLIGLELNDAGILAAGGSPPGLLELDGPGRESPGFALPQKIGLLVGKTAERKAHLFPRQILTRFWDQLNTEPLKPTRKNFPLNHAEVAYHHLALIWQQLQSHGDPVVLAVPSFYAREHLGLILGIAQELGMSVKGFVPASLAAAPYDSPDPEEMLLYLDIHLHRIEVVYLEQDEDLIIRDSATTPDKGLLHLNRKLVELIAREFVRATRFDPLHQAASEQELYDRLPGTLSHFQNNLSMAFEIMGSSTPYSVTLENASFIDQADSVNSEFLRLIKRMQTKRGLEQKPLALNLSHRLARLPGCKEILSTLENVRINALERGAAAMGVLQLWKQLAAQGNDEGIEFFTSRPWHRQHRIGNYKSSAEMKTLTFPTHLLHRSIAYPIAEKPLTIGYPQEGEQNDITITGETAGISFKHCAIKRQGEEIILEDLSEAGTFVDEQRVNGTITLKIGQIIRVGNSGEPFQVIACLNSSDDK